MVPSAPWLFVTRPAAQADEWVRRLQAQGVPARPLPLIAITAPDDPQAVLRAWSELSGCDWVIFVSPSAVEQFFAQAPVAARWPEGVRVATPGPGTDAALARAGVAEALRRRPRDEAEQFDSESLWDVLRAETWAGRRVLIVRGDGGRPWLAQRLTEAGAIVDFLSAYRRGLPVLDATEQAWLVQGLRAPGQAVWLFSSSQAIEHLVSLAQALGLQPDWSQQEAIVTHPRIGQRAWALGWRRVELSHPAPDAVAAAWKRRHDAS
ncbi:MULTISPECIES: uroporphyrinogen-III synthase [Caldimonas]|uniref:uroporphyrinogen-III synthase n=1 Tax=Caldimonas TaxID=196013 RepID=UPI00035E40ED|nr:uroporphyrinogen-III synthase [Caldimonas manganoxidans]MCX7659626.1 uroporphyrinogen-III synthase [Caldimonas manganoxidans]